jgi:hypothetical protein
MTTPLPTYTDINAAVALVNLPPGLGNLNAVLRGLVDNVGVLAGGGSGALGPNTAQMLATTSARIALGKVMAGGRSVFVLCGDSTSVDLTSPIPNVATSTPGFMAKALIANGIPGVYVPAFGQHNIPSPTGVQPYDNRITVGAGVSTSTYSCCGEWNLGVGQTLQFAFTSVDRMEIWWMATGDARTFTYSLDGAGAVTVSQSGAAGTFQKTVVTATAGTHTLLLTGAAGAFAFPVIGCDAYLTTAPSLPIFPSTMSGHPVNAENASWSSIAMVQALAPDCVWLVFAANEWQYTTLGGGTKTLLQAVTAITNVMDAAVAAGGQTGTLNRCTAIAATAYPGNAQQGPVVGQPFHDALVALAVSKGYQVADTAYQFGGPTVSWSIANNAGYMGGDSLHPQAPGRVVAARTLLQSLLV